MVTASRMIVSAQLTKVRTFWPVRFRWCWITTIGVTGIGSSGCRGIRAGSPTRKWTARPAPKRAGRGRYWRPRASSRELVGSQQELTYVGAGLVGVQRLEHRRRGVAVEPFEDGALAEGRAADQAHCLPAHVHHVVGDERLGQPYVRETQL